MRHLFAISLVGLTTACSGSVTGGLPTDGSGGANSAVANGATLADDGTAMATGGAFTSGVTAEPTGAQAMGGATLLNPDGMTSAAPTAGAGTTPTTTGAGTAASTTAAAGGLTPLADPLVTPSDPGRVTLHRLNNAEYNNTVRDLLGTSLTPADDFPLDGRGAGFDNMADVLSLSATHLELYSRAAQTLIDDALTNPTQRAAIISCDLAAQGVSCAREALAAFLPRAWRRPVVDAEVDRFMGPVNAATAAGESAEVGLGLALRAVLMSPNFLFRVELDASPGELMGHALTNHELASRLSYFLWSSMPDADLFAAADAGTLTAALESQVTRMLQSPKATETLIDNFAGQWLRLRAVDEVAPDAATFASFDDDLRAAMRTESEMLFTEIISTGAPMKTLLVADYTYLNDRLAQHYGMTGPGSSEFVRVSLAANTERRGLLGHASILTVTSHPRRTSPVNRGKWVMDDLMCQPIPAPPADVDTATFEADALAEGATLRQRLEAHRADPSCAACHRLMDPIGFGLENYDAVGAFRAMDNGSPVDATGQLPDGSLFTGPLELVEALSGDEHFSRCVAQKLFTYAIGRPPILTDSNYFDPSTIDSLTQLISSGASFESIVQRLATSTPFTNRRGDDGTQGASL